MPKTPNTNRLVVWVDDVTKARLDAIHAPTRSAAIKAAITRGLEAMNADARKAIFTAPTLKDLCDLLTEIGHPGEDLPTYGGEPVDGAESWDEASALFSLDASSILTSGGAQLRGPCYYIRPRDESWLATYPTHIAMPLPAALAGDEYIAQAHVLSLELEAKTGEDYQGRRGRFIGA
ncbi:MAG: hypothetical protein COW42_13930 [Deltaproteobacteria bacterium CG17_big_fil_post_rev_8_21_14_2_50_63_7]|nr:MAG: hypothetical protein COW42_13930 [Deltaproteobacteria bacterium CG17_big_fil_post_rev_8_21_14_2_50_63_7]